MAKIIMIDFEPKQKEENRFMNEDAYRDGILSALSALQNDDAEMARHYLVELLDDVEKVAAGGEL